MSSVLGLALSIIFGNFFSKELFGTYKYIQAMAGFLGIFALSGMGMAITRAVARGYDRTLILGVKTAIRWSFLSGLASIILGAYYLIHGNRILGLAFLLISIFLPFKDTLSLYRSMLEGKKLFSVETKYALLNQIVTSGTLILVVFLTQNIFIVLAAYFAPKVLMGLIFYLRTLRMIPPESQEDPSALSYGKHLSLLGILMTISEQLDKLLVWNSVGAIQLALYSFSIAPVIQGRGFLNNIFHLTLPKIAKGDVTELKKKLPRSMLLMVLPMVAIVTTYIISAPLLYRIFLPKYSDSILLSQIFSLSLLFLPRGFMTDAITLHAPNKYLYIFNLSTSCVRIAILVPLVFYYGALGAILAYIASEIYITALSSYIFFRKI